MSWPSAARSLVDDTDPAATALAISNSVHDAMTYQPGATGVRPRQQRRGSLAVASARTTRISSSVRFAMSASRLGMCRATCIPTPTPRSANRCTGESHAWVEWWCGEWVAHDPTNATMVADRHVQIGSARDYRDIPPIKGIVAGSPVTTDLSVEVEITRLA